ncbi:MAG: RHS repeat-associated core domain-containing protein [Pirellulales bacterium]
MCINIATGAVELMTVDAMFPAKVPFRLVRTYHSQEAAQTRWLGSRWSSDLPITADLFQDRVVVQVAAGSELIFERQGASDELWLDRESLTPSRVMIGRDEVIFHAADGHQWYLKPITADSSQYRAIERVDRNGNRMAFEYDRRNRLVEVVDSELRRFVLEYDQRSMLHQIRVTKDGHRENLIVSSYEYDDDGNLIVHQDASGSKVQYEYRDNLLVRFVNRLGGNMFFQYDDQRRCCRTWCDGGLKYRHLQFDTKRRLTVVTDGLGFQTVYAFNEAGLCTERQTPDGETYRTIIGANQELLWSDDIDVHNGSFRKYDQEQRSTTVTDATGAERRYFFGMSGQVARYESPTGLTTEIEHDARGNVLCTRLPSGRTWRYEYDDQGRCVRVVNPAGNDLSIHYRTDPDQVEYSDALGAISRLDYDWLGRLTAVNRAGATIVQLTYDALGRPVSASFADGAQEYLAWDAAGNLLAVENAVGDRTTRTYDRWSNPVALTDPLGHTIRIEYDLECRPSMLVNEAGQRAVWTYNARGLLVQRSHFDGRIERFEYDRNGYVCRTVDGAGRTTELERDPLGRVIRQSYADGSFNAFEFDQEGRLTSAANQHCEVTLGYDPDGLLIRDGQRAASIEYVRDIMGRVGVIRSGGRNVCELQYDKRGRIQQIAADSDTLQIDYSIDGKEWTYRGKGGFEWVQQFDGIGKLIHQRAVEGDARVLVERGYSYDPAGRLVRISDAANRSDMEFQYDRQSQLLSVRERGKTIAWYRYDACRNVVATHDLGDLSYHDGNRLESGVNLKCEYDACGNLERRTVNGRTVRLAFDHQNRLVTTHGEESGKFEYSYDAFNRRIGKSSSFGTTQYVWAGNLLLQERGPAGEATSYVYAPGILTPVMIQEGRSCSLVVHDHLQTPIAATSPGEKQSTPGIGTPYEGPALGGSIPVPFRLPGQYLDAETGLYYNRNRYYDPVLRRYISNDPLAFRAGWNFYAFASNSPTNLADFLGLQCFRPECESLYQDMDNAMNTQTAKDPATGSRTTTAPHPGAGYQAPHGMGLGQRGAEIVANHGRQPLERIAGDPLGQTMTVASHWQQWWNIQNTVNKKLTKWMDLGCTPANTSNPAQAASVENQALGAATANAPNPSVVGDPATMNGIGVWNPSSGIPDPGMPF